MVKYILYGNTYSFRAKSGTTKRKKFKLTPEWMSGFRCHFNLIFSPVLPLYNCLSSDTRSTLQLNTLMLKVKIPSIRCLKNVH